MENSQNITNFATVSFPVFKLKNAPPQVQDNLVFYETEYYNEETQSYSSNIAVVDDTSIAKHSFSDRRLELLKRGANLYSVKYIVYFLGDLIKLAKTPQHYFIDNTGKVFCYQKTTRAKLRFYKVKRVLPLSGLGAIIEVHGLAERFKTLYKPHPTLKWAGIVQYQSLNILYGLYFEQYKETWRAI